MEAGTERARQRADTAFPQGTPLKRSSQERLDTIVEKIKALAHRPRKSLEYRTPNEVFSEHLFALQT
jgi:IS30 family transposase